MRVLVTGGAGYIGSVVAEVLVAEGHGVVVYDNLAKGHRDAVPPGAEFVHADLGDATALRQTLERQRVEAVVHMAADSLVGESVTEPAKYYANNVGNGLALLDAMRAAGVARLVFSSTVAVHGEPTKLPIEEDDPTAPVNPYGETKLAFERALRWYGEAYGLHSVSLRYFNAAGATELCGERHDPETHLVPIVLDVAAGDRDEVTVFGDDYPTRDGTCIRDYIHVRDLARAHVLAIAACDAGAAVYNLGVGGEGTTVLEVLDAARAVTGHPIPARVGPRRPGDPARLVASSARIERALGWRPEIPDIRTIVESAWRFRARRAAARDARRAPG
ncbi:MAG: UDP-glucose 4-epimerase GalE [Proteobacteria bacterium]|nr:MAG: UDP-glucose 4-epimerase GalE [Pseudomonadota bacterium]